MINYIFLMCLMLSAPAYASQEKTDAIRVEIGTHQNPNFTQETHPTVYEMVRELAEKANVEMPRYISMFNAEYAVVPRDGGVVTKGVHTMHAYVDVLGDLYICRELLMKLSYEELQGVIALALAEKNINTPLKLTYVFAGTLGLTIAAAYCLNKYYDGKILGYFMSNKTDYYHRTFEGRRTESKLVAAILVGPAVWTTNVSAHYFQKHVDINAAKIVDASCVISAIKGIDKVTDTYVKEGFFSRIAGKLKLKELCNYILYPIRGYTSEERIAYLMALENA